MRIFFGVVIGLVLAIVIAGAAAHHAFGGFKDIGGRDKSQDISQTFDLAEFDRIEVGGVFEIDVNVGGDFSVKISGAPDEMAQLEATVTDGVLSLDQDHVRIGKNRWRDTGLTAVISMPALNGLSVSGVADGEVDGIKSEAFQVDLSGVGDLDLSGSCDQLDAQVSGVGDLDASELECRIVSVDVSGVGEASVYASESVDASVNGIGSINIYGSPAQVDKSTTFLSSISVK